MARMMQIPQISVGDTPQFTPDLGGVAGAMGGLAQIFELRRQDNQQLTQSSLQLAAQERASQMETLLNIQREDRMSKESEMRMAAEALKTAAQVEMGRMQIAAGVEQLRQNKALFDEQLRTKAASRETADLQSQLQLAAAANDFTKHHYLVQRLQEHPKFKDLDITLRTKIMEEDATIGRYKVGNSDMASLYRDATNRSSSSRAASAATLLEISNPEFRATLKQQLQLDSTEEAKVESLLSQSKHDAGKLAEWQNSDRKKALDAARDVQLMSAEPGMEDAVNDSFDEKEARMRASFMGVAYAPEVDPRNPTIAPKNLMRLLDRLATTPARKQQLLAMSDADVASLGVRELTSDLAKQLDTPTPGKKVLHGALQAAAAVGGAMTGNSAGALAVEEGVYQGVQAHETNARNKEIASIRGDLGSMVAGAYGGTATPDTIARGMAAIARYNTLAAERGMAPLDITDLIPMQVMRRMAPKLAANQNTVSAFTAPAMMAVPDGTGRMLNPATGQLTPAPAQ
jgi:hypothetical protein